MGFFVDLQFNTTTESSLYADRGWPFGEDAILEFTSLMSIVHRNGTNVYPYDECSGEQCLGKII